MYIIIDNNDHDTTVVYLYNNSFYCLKLTLSDKFNIYNPWTMKKVAIKYVKFLTYPMHVDLCAVSAVIQLPYIT